MSILNRETVARSRRLLPTQANRKRWPVARCKQNPALQDVLFSELFTSVCYWSTVLLLAIAGAALVYWRLTHPGTFADAGQRSVWRNDTSMADSGSAANRGCGLSRPRSVACSPRPTCLENVGDGGRFHRGHGRDHDARNTLGGPLKRDFPQLEQSRIIVEGTVYDPSL